MGHGMATVMRSTRAKLEGGNVTKKAKGVVGVDGMEVGPAGGQPAPRPAEEAARRRALSQRGSFPQSFPQSFH